MDLQLQSKDILTLAVSFISAVIALTALFVTYRQRSREDSRGMRKSLTDTLASMAEVNLAMAKLRLEHPESNDSIVGLRRAYNSQRRYLASHAEFLLEQIPSLSTDIDHNLLAQAFDTMGHYEKALEHWKACVEKSPGPSLRAMNLRGFARFLFFQGNSKLGQQKYDESLQVDLPDNDSNRRLRADTYAMWSVTEREFGFVEEARRRREQGLAEAKRIGHSGMRDEILQYIDSLWSQPAVPSAATQAYPPATEPAPVGSKASNG